MDLKYIIMKIKPGLNVNESGFLFDPSTGESYSLNEMGIRYFNMISGGLSKENIRDAIIREFDVEDSVFEKSFIDFEARLRYLRLVENE